MQGLAGVGAVLTGFLSRFLSRYPLPVGFFFCCFFVSVFVFVLSELR